MFFTAFMTGSAMGITLERAKMKNGGFAVLVLAAIMVSFVGYHQATITITDADKPLAVSEAPMSSEDPRGQELVYVYGKDEPVTRAEFERLLAYSSENSPGDAE